MAGRRFTEQETAKILRKAAELQGQTGAHAPGSLATEDEIKAAAKEVGIDPRWIEAAVESLDAEGDTSPVGFFGGPASVEREIAVQGRVSVEDWEETILEFRKRFKENGTVQTRPDVFEWSGTGGGVRPVLLTMRQTGEAVKVSLSIRNDSIGGMIFGLGLIPTFIGMGVASRMGAMAPAFMLLWITFAFLAGRALYTYNAKKSEVVATELLNGIRKRVEEDDLRERLSEPSAVEDASTSNQIHLG